MGVYFLVVFFDEVGGVLVEGFFFVVSVFDEEAEFFFDGVCPVGVWVYVVEEVVSCGCSVVFVFDGAVWVE